MPPAALTSATSSTVSTVRSENEQISESITTVEQNVRIGNRDATPTPRPYFEGPTATYNTLADIAKYFYDTDLRDAARAGYNGTTTDDNCTVTSTDDDTGVSFTRNVCENNVFVTPTDNNTKQHITTFTLGLGVDGNLQFQDDYQTTTDTTSDFYQLRNGTGSPVVNWPVPQSGTQTTVDDLWHAAGRPARGAARAARLFDNAERRRL